jgi:hypothetical protein
VLYYIRVLDSKRYWDTKEHDQLSWLNNDELPSDALLNVKTQNNSLSIYLLDDEGADLEKILCAHASTRDHINRIDYVVISEDMLLETGMELENTPGQTPVNYVNDLHHDIVHISADRLIGMVKSSIINGWICRLTPPKVKKLIKSHVDIGTIKLEQLKHGVQTKLAP